MTNNGIETPKKLSFGETGTVPLASVLGFEGGNATGRTGVVILTPLGKNSSEASQTLTYAVDLTDPFQLASFGAASGSFEKFSFAPSPDLSSGAGLVVLRGRESGGQEVSAIVKLGSDRLAKTTTDTAALVPEKLPVLPTAYGLAIGTSGRGLQTTASGYLAIRSEDAVSWTDRRCERGVVAAFPVSLK